MLSVILFQANANDNIKSLNDLDDLRSKQPALFIKLLSKYESSVNNKYDEYDVDLFLFLKAYSYALKGDFNQSVNSYIELIKQTGYIDIKFRSILSLVNQYSILQNWQQALYQINQANQLQAQIKDPKLLENYYAVLGIFYNQFGNKELTKQYAQKLLKLASSERNQCVAENLLIASLTAKEKNPFNLENSLCKKADETLLYLFAVLYHAEFKYKQKNYSSAFQLIEKHKNSFSSINYPPLTIKHNTLVALISLAINDFDRAKEFSNIILQTNKRSLGSKKPISDASRILYQIAKQQGDYQAALQYHEQYMQSNNAYLDEVKAKALAYQLAEHQSLEQQNQIALLDRQNNLLKTEQKLAKAEAENNRLFISLLIALSTLLVFWVYKNKLTQQKLKQLAEYDTLTRLINRGHFTQLAESLLAKLKRQKQPVSMIMFDLDKFKAINDTYGHATGDWVLKQVSSTLSKIVRKNDILARLGGEEFAILLPNCEQAKAQQLANYYRQAIADIDCADSGFDFTISASFGVTDNQLSGYKFDTLLAHADYALYASKRSGRNQVTVYNSSIPAINITPSDKS